MVSAKALLIIVAGAHTAYSIPYSQLLEIRDAPSSIPVRSTKISPSRLLQFMRKNNPSLHASTIEHQGELDFEVWNFNTSMWNTGVAEYLSDPTVSKKFCTKAVIDSIQAAIKAAVKAATLPTEKYTEIKPGKSSSIAPAATPLARRSENVPEDDQTKNDPLAAQPIPFYRPDASKEKPLKGYNVRAHKECFEDGVYATLEDIRIWSNIYCTKFDQRLWQWLTGSSPGPIRDFKEPTVHTVVQRGKRLGMAFVFFYDPYYPAVGNKLPWFPFSMLTGIQGICRDLTNAFSQVDICPCKGKNPDSRRALIGLDMGVKREYWIPVFAPEEKNKPGWSLRWIIDPFTLDDPEDDPMEYPETELDNGLA